MCRSSGSRGASPESKAEPTAGKAPAFLGGSARCFRCLGHRVGLYEVLGSLPCLRSRRRRRTCRPFVDLCPFEWRGLSDSRSRYRRYCAGRVCVQALCPGFTYSQFHDILGVDRKSMAPASFWLTADQVVDSSLAGLRRRSLFVVPGAQYKILTALFTKLPAGLRLAIEAGRGNPTPTRSAAGERR